MSTLPSLRVAALAALLAGAPALGTLHGQEEPQGPAAVVRTPWAVATSPDGATLYVTDRTAAVLTAVDLRSRRRVADIPLRGRPDSLCVSADGRRIYVAERGASSVAVIDAGMRRVESRIPVGRRPVAVALAGERLLVCHEDTHDVEVVDLRPSPPRSVGRVPLVREPCAVAVAPDGRRAVVANRLPLGRGTDPDLAAVVSLVDLGTLGPPVNVPLPPGSTAVQGVCASPDGRWAYAVHALGRFKLPMTQLERGWVNTFALSVIDVERGARRATLLLDDLQRGAADPHGVVCSADGRSLWITHAGVHEVSHVDIGLVHRLLDGDPAVPLRTGGEGYAASAWVRLRKDKGAVDLLTNDLSALRAAGAIRRFPSGGKGPRGLALAPDGTSVLVAQSFSGSVGVLDAGRGELESTIPLGPSGEPDAVRRGEILFHDATYAFQSWHSCATCHPNDGRVDGLKWDFVDDGIGNAMDTLGLAYAHETGKLHRLGTLADVREAARHGLTFTHLRVPTEAQVGDLVAYLSSLRTEPSPHLEPDGGLSASARRGKVLFEGKADCARCHAGPRFTDLQFWDVGVESPAKYKTTSLLELHRTAPYLHDGRALTLEEVLTAFNPEDRHGRTRGLTPEEIRDLAAYLRSL